MSQATVRTRRKKIDMECAREKIEHTLRQSQGSKFSAEQVCMLSDLEFNQANYILTYRCYTRLLKQGLITTDCMTWPGRGGRKPGSKTKKSTVTNFAPATHFPATSICKVRNLRLQGHDVHEICAETGYPENEVRVQVGFIDRSLAEKSVKPTWVYHVCPKGTIVHTDEKDLFGGDTSRQTNSVTTDLLKAAERKRIDELKQQMKATKQQIEQHLLDNEQRLRQQALQEMLDELN